MLGAKIATIKIRHAINAGKMPKNFLRMKKKRLETRFFELTGNESGDISRK
jgi:phosphoribosylcarboxyaminoimidazole (NCAIR) mutase